MILNYDEIESPIGTIVLVANRSGVCALGFDDRRDRMGGRLDARYGSVELRRARDPLRASTLVRAYLAGDLDALDDVPVDAGGTPFQRRVWAILRKLQAGKTATYGEIARRLGRPDSARAVGAANGSNPIALVVPCHRVVGANGSLVGYAGGLERKRWLLAHEGVAG